MLCLSGSSHSLTRTLLVSGGDLNVVIFFVALGTHFQVPPPRIEDLYARPPTSPPRLDCWKGGSNRHGVVSHGFTVNLASFMNFVSTIWNVGELLICTENWAGTNTVVVW